MIIAIDGPAGVGKSTVARSVARALGLTFLDTGAMYRAVTLEALRRGIDPGEAGGCTELARSLALAFDDEGRIQIDGKPGEPDVRSTEVSRAVSEVSAHPGVRAVIVDLQRAMGEAWGGLVAEGRDTTTVVFPHATHKFFLKASSEERARRRARELGRTDVDAVREAMERRDHLDSTRDASPLRQAPDAFVVDTGGRPSEDVVREVLEVIEAGRASHL